MGYYCTVPQCTSLAGKTKNVKFHRFPRDVTMADKWNIILKRGKPYTKYSKVCSLHFTQADYNVTTMGQWKTLSKDAVPSQNLPKLNPDGTVMVIRKSRTVKYRDGKKEDSDKMDKWSMPLAGHSGLVPHPPPTPDVCTQDHESSVLYRLQTLGAIANTISPQNPLHAPHLGLKPKKQDAFMQTDPVQNEDDDTQPNNSYSEVSDKSFNSEIDPYGYPKEDYPKDNYPKDNYPKDSYQKDPTYPKETSYSKDSYLKDSFPKESYSKDSSYQKGGPNYPKDNAYQQKDGGYQQKDPIYQAKESSYQQKDDDYGKDKLYEPKDYTNKASEDYIPQTNEEYNKEAEKYALERKSHNGYDMKEIYQKQMENSIYQYDKNYQREYLYQSGYPDSAEVLRNQQHNLQILQETHRLSENQNFFNENHIKQEIDISVDDYERSKDGSAMYSERRLAQRLIDHMPIAVKQETPDTPNGCNVTLQPQSSPYPYQPIAHSNLGVDYYNQLSRPGPEMLKAKQNALAAQTQLWHDTMKRPFFYSETPHYNGPPLLHHRFEDISRILQ